MPISVHPKDFEKGGGLPNNILLTVKSSKYETREYKNSQYGGGSGVSLIWECEDEIGGTHEIYLGVGSAEIWKVIENGNDIVSDTASKLNDNSGLAKFMVTAVEKGFPPAVAEAVTASTFVGFQFVIEQRPTGSKKKVKGKDGKLREYDVTETVCGRIVKAPSSGAPTSAATAQSDSAPDPGVESRAIETLVALFESGEEIPATKLTGKLVVVLSKLGYKKDLAAISKLLTPEFINESGVAVHDGTTIKPAV